MIRRVPVNVSIVYVEGAAMMAMIPIPIVPVGTSFTRIPSDSLCMVISSLGPPRQIIHEEVFLEYSFQAVSGCDSALGDESRYS